MYKIHSQSFWPNVHVFVQACLLTSAKAVLLSNPLVESKLFIDIFVNVSRSWSAIYLPNLTGPVWFRLWLLDVSRNWCHCELPILHSSLSHSLSIRHCYSLRASAYRHWYWTHLKIKIKKIQIQCWLQFCNIKIKCCFQNWIACVRRCFLNSFSPHFDICSTFKFIGAPVVVIYSNPYHICWLLYSYF